MGEQVTETVDSRKDSVRLGFRAGEGANCASRRDEYGVIGSSNLELGERIANPDALID